MKRKQNASVPSSPVLASLKMLMVFILIIGLCLSFYPRTAYATEVDGDSELVADETRMDTINEKALQTIENNGLTVKEVSLGDYHSAAITSDGNLYMWGYNEFGQLGDGTKENRTTPKKVESLSDVTAVSLGDYHSAAITSDGSLYMWGHNWDGQLGDGTMESRTTPKKIESLTDVTAVSLGDYHSAAITSDGSLYTWGDNSHAQLGNGTTLGGYQTTPKKVASLSNVTAVSLGWFHSAAITSDGSLYTWGRNYAGQLGDGTTEERTTPKKVESLSDVTAVSLGGIHSAAITSDGSLYTWGDNGRGQLGDGTTEDKTTPKKVESLSDVTAVSLGGIHSATITSDGSLYTWGDNGHGQLGDGTTENQNNIPTKVPFFQSGQGQNNDVDPSAWYAPFVAKAVQYGFMKGTSDTTFEPEGIFTREMTAQVLYNAFGNGEVSPSCGMQDVDQSRWYAPAVNWVVEHGYMRGTSNGFGVGQKITREEFARMLANYKGIDLNAIDTSVLNNYPDAGNLHDWGRTAMAWAVKSGILSGSQTDAGILLAPEQDSNRGMAAALFVKARDNNVI